MPDRSERPERGTHTELSIRFDGVKLPPGVLERIASAVRKSVLLEVADLDLSDGVHVRDLAAMANGGGGGTQGVAIIANVVER